MQERPDDLVALQRLIDDSYASAGDHLREIHAPERRLDAEQLVARLDGMCLLTLATTTRDGRPITGPVDGVFYRGAFHFGSSPTSLRFRHIGARPAVSATHLPGEHFAVSVHGLAQPIDLDAEAHAGFRRTLLDMYLPRYGDAWLEVVEGGMFARIEARRLFAFWMPDDGTGPG